MERQLNALLNNYMNSLKGVIAVALVDKDGLIIASETREEAQENSDTVIGVLSAILDEYIERIKREFGTESSFFNITTTGDKKFSFCSQGEKTILTTLANPDTGDIELKVLSEHVAGKAELLIGGKENVSTEIPQIIKVLSQTRGGKLPEGEYSTKLILTGDWKVGKTSLIRRFVENKFKDEYISTIGVDITKHVVDLSEKTKINFIIWDVGGQNLAPYRKRFYEGANCAMIVVDRTRKETLENVEKWVEDIKESVKIRIPIIIVANKSDLIDEIVISEEDVRNAADEHGFNYIITSAKTGENVNDAFSYIAYKFLERI
ncbi:MAG: Small GTP-binding domain protein [Promethearchaeota archaeon]|jgi:small GTP-binding protein|nr:MAG: Small GTP-binding domain protein [Candidatus Lokiarchaeota archaeon]